MPARSASIRDTTSAPQPAWGFMPLARARRFPLTSYKPAASVVVPISTAAPKEANDGFFFISGRVSSVRICPESVSSGNTMQSSCTLARQASRIPLLISAAVRRLFSLSERLPVFPSTLTRHFPQRPWPPQGIPIYPCCASRFPRQLSCATVYTVSFIVTFGIPLLSFVSGIISSMLSCSLKLVPCSM